MIKGGTVNYFHKDHLTSASAMTDFAGLLTESNEYLPYGHVRFKTGIEVSNYNFTDQELDTETGLYNYDARLYDPVIGRFISADSVVPDWGDPQSLNRYAYARNNPLKYVDPDGNSFLDAIPSTIAAGVGYFGIGVAYVGTRPAIGLISFFDKSGAAQANMGVNGAFGRIVEIQTKYVAVPAVAGDAIGAGIGAGYKAVKGAGGTLKGGVGEINYYKTADGPHFTVKTEGVETLHTEQVVIDANKNTTMLNAPSLKPDKTFKVNVPDINAAQAAQKSKLNQNLGTYEANTNSCLTSAAEVLNAGGAKLPNTSRAIIRKLRK